MNDLFENAFYVCLHNNVNVQKTVLQMNFQQFYIFLAYFQVQQIQNSCPENMHRKKNFRIYQTTNSIK